jgi:hypothetical protein
MAISDFDFSGWVTKNDLKCSDGRTIRKDAFKENDGTRVPLVYQHLHSNPGNVLGHMILENRDEGVYGYGYFNDTEDGLIAKKLVMHKDIDALSIYANELVEQTKNVLHGVIREVSLVLAGANKGARIDFLSLAHADGSETDLDDEAIIYVDKSDFSYGKQVVQHAATDQNGSKTSDSGKDMTVGEVFDTLTDIQKEVVYALIAEVADSAANDNKNTTNTNIAHADATADMTVGEVFDTLTDIQKEVVYALIAEVADSAAGDTANAAAHSDQGEKVVNHNVFDNKDTRSEQVLTTEQFKEITADAMKAGSFKDSFMAHAVDYGIENIDLLFPDAQAISNSPAMISRRMEWVAFVLNAANHTPFSRIKSMAADITEPQARARGYVKGTQKKDEVIKLLRRITTPKTIYKKQKLDRDDIVDITDIDVVAWLKGEMRVMFDEELARAILVTDGRASDDPDKIDEDNIRPIWTDDDMYAHHIRLASTAETDDVIDAVIRARENYFGSGTPTLYTTSAFVSNMLLMKDTLGRRLYSNLAELMAVLRVSAIVEVPVMAGLSRESDDDVPVHLDLVGIIVNMKDYTIGADKGGQTSFFENFDIDFNQQKYLLECRVSGALTLPKSALVIEKVGAAG